MSQKTMNEDSTSAQSRLRDAAKDDQLPTEVRKACEQWANAENHLYETVGDLDRAVASGDRSSGWSTERRLMFDRLAWIRDVAADIAVRALQEGKPGADEDTTLRALTIATAAKVEFRNALKLFSSAPKGPRKG